MRNQEIQRRILDLLVLANGRRTPLSDSILAKDIGTDRIIVQGNLQLLEETGYVELSKVSMYDGGLMLTASITPKGYVLLHEPDEAPADRLLFEKAMLEVMERQVAGFGKLYAPPYLVVQLEEQRQRVAALEEEQ